MPEKPRLRDACGRVIDYLRLSVTDACNLRCSYCRPEDKPEAGDSLSDPEIVSLVEILAGLGMRRVRVTGGEPLARRGIADLVGRLAGVRGVEDLSMTTNGLLLAGSAAGLAGAGLRRVNISLDSLRPDRFKSVSGVDGMTRVLDGIEAALAAGLSPVKVNVVVMRGFNDDEVADFAAMTADKPLHVRFIELMPLGSAGASCGRSWVSMDEIRRRIGRLEPLRGPAPAGAGPASYLRLPGAAGTVGFIGALSRKFCSDCNRLRLTASGRLLSCLTRSGPEADLGVLIRSGARPERIETLVRELVRGKKRSHEMAVGTCAPDACMASIGG